MAYDRLVDLQLDESFSPSAIFSSAGGDGCGPGEPDQILDNCAPRESENFRMIRFGSLVNLESVASVSFVLVRLAFANLNSLDQLCWCGAGAASSKTFHRLPFR